MRNQRWVGWIFVLPALFVFTAIVMIPIAWSLSLSLGSWNGLSKWRFTGIENYLRMFQDTVFRQALFNSLYFAALGSLAQLVLGMAMAVAIARARWFRNAIRVAYFIRAVISTVAVS